MKFKNPWVQKFWKFSTSFQLGIPILIAIMLLIMWGTIVESQYDAYAAQQLIYKSWMMYAAMILLIYNLTIVMVDRLPWKLRHWPFILVHIGIITIIGGGYVTQKWGIDGSLSLPLGGKSSFVMVNETDFVVYATYTGDNYTKIFDREVDFFKDPPTATRPFVIPMGEEKIELLEYVKYARVNKKISAVEDPQSGSSVKIQLMNANVKQIETLTQPAPTKSVDVNLGPLRVVLGADVEVKGRKKMDQNEIYLDRFDKDFLHFGFYKKNELKPFKSGQVKIGDVVETGWMGLEFRVLDYLYLAKEEWEVKPVDRPTPLTTSAVKVRYKGKEQWLLLNDILKFFGHQEAYIVSYQNRRLDLGFPIILNEFQVTHYEGTQKAKEYASNVSVGLANTNSNQRLSSAQAMGLAVSSEVISMNEPMKYGGYTFYQASFSQDERTGEPTASILSVNKDPGRWIKYLGSLILSLGIIWLFYQKRKRATAT